MKRIVSLLLVLVVVLGCVGLAACNGGAVVDNGGNGSADGNGNGDGESLSDILGHGADIYSVSYDMEITVPNTPTVLTKMWVEGNKIRMEMEQQGQHIIYLSNYDTGKAYMYMPDQNMAIEIDISQIGQPDYESAQSIPNYNPKELGTQTMDGKVCLVVEYSYGGATVKSWIWKQHGFPIRTEMTTAEGTIITVFTNIDFGDIPDSKFELPPGVEIMEF